MSGLLDGIPFGDVGEAELDPFEEFMDSLMEGLPSPSALMEEQIALRDWDGDYGGLKMPGYHASFVAGNECVNAYVHHYRDPRDLNPDPKLRRIFQNGDSVHTRLQDYMTPYLLGTWKCRQCRAVWSENVQYADWLRDGATDRVAAEKELKAIQSEVSEPQPVPEECGVCGHKEFRYKEWRIIDRQRKIAGKTDGILRIGNQLYGWEIKSANDNSFRSMRPDTRLMKKYRNQFGIYMTVAGLDSGFITVENKNNQELRDFPVFMSDLDLKPVYERIDRSNAIVRGDEELPVPRRCDSCGDCPYLGNGCKPRG